MNYYDLNENEIIKKFIHENDIDVERIRKLPEAKTLTGKEINPIAFDYGIWKKNERARGQKGRREREEKQKKRSQSKMFAFLATEAVR